MSDAQPVTFPTAFLWGAATSAHQVEGHNLHNDWWAWEQAGRVREPSGAACEHYERYREDFDLARHLGHNAHRFSVEWSRVEPEPYRWDERAIEHYREVVRALRERDLEPIVTLFHFTSPRWFSEQGGFQHPRAMSRFARYVERVVEAIGEQVRYWITLNEPMIYIYQGYLTGVWPPGRRSTLAALHIWERMLHAHTVAYHLIHDRLARQTPPPMVSVAKHMIRFAPCNPQAWQDRVATRIRHRLFNEMVVRAFRRGHLIPRLRWLGRWPVHRGALDFIGLNYYTRDFVHFKGWTGGRLFGELCSLAHHRTAGPRNSLGWEIYPRGLYESLRELARYRLPILITENGLCTDDDAQRWAFIRDHLAQVGRALQEGIPVAGYLYWSLLDNFEWAEGFTPRFGLLEVDYATQGRHIRPSAEQLAEICRTGQLST